VNKDYSLIHVVVFWVVTTCSDVVGYRRFGGIMILRNIGDRGLNLHRREHLMSRVTVLHYGSTYIVL